MLKDLRNRDIPCMSGGMAPTPLQTPAHCLHCDGTTPEHHLDINPDKECKTHGVSIVYMHQSNSSAKGALIS